MFDARAFHEVELPSRLRSGNGALAAGDARALGPLALCTPSGAWTYSATDDGSVAVLAGVEDDARVVVELDDASMTGLARDVDTPVAMLYQQRASVVRGNPLRFIRWEPALRAMYHARPLFDPQHVDLRGSDGTPLDPAAPFDVDAVTAAPHRLADRLDVVGFAMVRQVFARHEVAHLLAEAESLRKAATPGDGLSWWGRTAGGEAVVTRVLNGVSSPSVRGLYDDDRVQRIADATGMELQPRHSDGRDGVAVLWKIPDMAEGLADLPWHRDCGMGGHATNCPTVVMTICLTAGGPEAGELRALPGSHRTSHPFIDGTAVGAPDGVAIAVTAGDLSLHNGDVMHASLPPTSSVGPHRVSILLSFSRPAGSTHLGSRHYNDALLGNPDGQVEHLGQRLGQRLVQRLGQRQRQRQGQGRPG